MFKPSNSSSFKPSSEEDDDEDEDELFIKYKVDKLLYVL